MLKIKENISLADLTTFKIGGLAKYFCQVNHKEEVAEAIAWAKTKGLPFFVLAGASNLLISDDGFAGLVIKLQTTNYKLQTNKLSAEAGVKLSDLVKLSSEQGLAGFEWSSGIPQATIGGALYMNAGAFGQTIADITEEVEVFDVQENKFKTLSFHDCLFSYKKSIFQKNKNLIILKAVFKIEKKDKKEIKKEIKRVLDYRQKNHPISFPSAGSVFKNPRRISAGELIEKVGLKGKKIGQACFADQHANFIINLGKASSSDVLALISLAKKQVKNKFKINLETEIEFLKD